MGIAYRPDEDLVIPSRVVTRLLAIIEFARARGGSAVAVDVNVVMDALQQSQAAATAESSATGTIVGTPSRLVSTDELLSVRTAAARLQCSERAITKALSEHRLAGTKAGGREWLIRAEDLDQYRFGGRHG